jgi:PAP2 superfamily
MERSLVRRFREWLTTCHSLRAEIAALLALYGLYELGRGLVVGDRQAAIAHAHDVVALERAAGVFVEARVQETAQSVPGLVGLLGIAYLTLHLGVTVGVLLWLHRRRPSAFAFARTTLLVASAFALAGFLLFPTAPPRLAGLAILDTVSGDHVNLNTGLVSSLYNPFAAVPSMHIGYAVVVGAVLARNARRAIVRAAGVAYAPFVLLVIVATGNHFFFDAAVGAAVAALAAAVTRLVANPPQVVRVPPALLEPRATGVEKIAA